MDNLFEQLTAISKAGAYDAIQPEYERLQKENAFLKSTIAQLEIMLKGEQDRVKALRDFINEVRPDNAHSIELGRVDTEIEQEFEDHKNNPDDLKGINI